LNFPEFQTQFHEKLTIAIDGPAGSGKSSVARLVAQKLGYQYLDSGACAGTECFTKRRLHNPESELPTARDTHINRPAPLTLTDLAFTIVLLDGEDVTWAIRTSSGPGAPESQSSQAFAKLRRRAAACRRRGGVVMRG
jgi:cytidylate kinase